MTNQEQEFIDSLQPSIRASLRTFANLDTGSEYPDYELAAYLYVSAVLKAAERLKAMYDDELNAATRGDS
jgi:hypothetical protein